MDILRDPVWTGAGAIASIVAVVLYAYVERERLFPQFHLFNRKSTDKNHKEDSIWWWFKSFSAFGITVGTIVLLSAKMQTVATELFGIEMFFYIGRIIFYLTLIIGLFPIGFLHDFLVFSFNIRDYGETLLLTFACYGSSMVLIYISFRFWPRTFDAIVASFTALGF